MEAFVVQAGRIVLVLAAMLLGAWVAIHVLRGVFWVIARVVRGIAAFVRHVFRFVTGMIGDSLRLVGGVFAIAMCGLGLGFQLLSGRWEAARHSGQAVERETMAWLGCLYRVCIGHVAHLLGLSPLTEGIERRVPDVFAATPPVGASARAASAPPEPGRFAGYRVERSLLAGGSGARLYLAEPEAAKRQQLAQAGGGQPVPARVVIKAFSLGDGSTLPQIVRESRALEAARGLGLVLEHELTAHRFHYVMPYVPGEDLGVVTARMHGVSAGDGLNDVQTRLSLDYACDLLATLDRFHRVGLWHKDVKPGNIIVSEGHCYLVDLGLTTPLASAMTLTTHGTEYFRDPEMVRLALKGVKVHEVDGVKFDLYSAGAVLYSLVENSFPAHGSLSQIGKRCPEALRWIIRRAMADLGHRYGSAQQMLTDLEAVRRATEPFAVRPADLPSFAGQPQAGDTTALAQAAALAAARAGLAAGAAGGGASPAGGAWPFAAPAAGSAAIGAGVGPAAEPGLPPRGQSLRAGEPRRRLLRRVPPLVRAAAVVVALGGAFLLVDSDEQRADEGRTVPDPAQRPVRGELVLLPGVSVDHPSASVPVAALASAGTLLLIDDLPFESGAQQRDCVEQLCQQLREGRWRVLRDAEPGDAADEQAAIALLAGARAAAGLADPTDAAAVERLSDYLRQQDAALDAIVWIGGGRDGEPLRCLPIARSDETRRELSALLEI